MRKHVNIEISTALNDKPEQRMTVSGGAALNNREVVMVAENGT